MGTTTRRALGLVLAVLLVAGIAVAVAWGRGGIAASRDLDPVQGVIGSEKKPFFDDPEVKAVFARHGLDVQVRTAGSRQIATSVDLTGVDFVFPSSAPAAERLKETTGKSTAYAPFYSPMAIATFTPIVQLLAGAGIAHQDANGQWRFDVGAYLDAVAAGTRWNQLPGADELYDTSRSLLVSSTDVRTSNSAAMYLAIASYVANDDAVVATAAQRDAVIDAMAGLFLQQGFSASSSEEPFDDYLSQGIGSKPLVMIYEAQFLGRQMNDATKSSVTPDMALMYPSPTVLSKHTLIPLTDAGDRVGQLLTTDADLQRLAAQYGFRPADPAVFAATLQAHGLAAPATPVDVVEPPSYETLEAMIEEISARYDASAGTAPAATTTTPSDQGASP
jgi:hypothetical protein